MAMDLDEDEVEMGSDPADPCDPSVSSHQPVIKIKTV